MVAQDDTRVQRCGFCKLEGDGVEEFFCHRYEIVLGRRSKTTRLDVVLEHWELEVMGKNGVTVNGTLYTPSSNHLRLRSRDLITMGESSFHFLLPSKVSRHLEGGQPVVKRQRTSTQRASPARRASPLPVASSAATQHALPLQHRASLPSHAPAIHPINPGAARPSTQLPARPQVTPPAAQQHQHQPVRPQQLVPVQQQQAQQAQQPELQQQARPAAPRITLADQMQQQAVMQAALAERQRRALEQAAKLREAEARLDAQERERAQARLAMQQGHALVPEHAQAPMTAQEREGKPMALAAQDDQHAAERERAQKLLIAQEQGRAQARLEAQHRALAQQQQTRLQQQEPKQEEPSYAVPSQARQQQVISLQFPPQQPSQPIRLPQSTAVRIPLHQSVYRQLQQQQQQLGQEDSVPQPQSVQARASSQLPAQPQGHYQLPSKISAQYPLLMQTQRMPNTTVDISQQHQHPTLLQSTPLGHGSMPQQSGPPQPVSASVRMAPQSATGPSLQSQPLIQPSMPMRTMTILPQQLSASAQQLSPALHQSQPQQSPFQQQQQQTWARPQGMPMQYIPQGSSQLAAQSSFGSRPSTPSPFTGMRTASSGHMVTHPSLTLARPSSVPISLSIPQNGLPDKGGPADSRPNN